MGIRDFYHANRLDDTVMTAGLHQLTITALAPLLESRAVTAAVVLDSCLAQIAARNGELNALIRVTEDDARAQAREADREIAAGRYRGPLHGIPITVKDLVDVRGTATTAASRVRAGHRADADAPVIERLRAAGAVLVGKCNLHEFAFGTTSEESAFGPVHNPHDLSRSAGGSSGGSAAAVVAGMCLGSVGTDTGGSIRIPAAACGIVGLKPTYGEVPCDGVVPLSWSLDHLGPLARSVDDARLLFWTMAGRKERRPDDRVPERATLGILAGYFLDRLEDEVRRAFEQTIGRLGSAGHAVEKVAIPHANKIATVYLHMVFPEAATYHARTLETRPQDYSKGIRDRLELARYVLAEDYIRSLKGRDILQQEVNRALAGRDVLLLPTLPIVAPRLGAKTVQVNGTHESVRNLMLRLTQLFNLTGHPAITIPMGASASGLPCGLQIVGRHGQTDDLLRLAASFERVLASST